MAAVILGPPVLHSFPRQNTSVVQVDDRGLPLPARNRGKKEFNGHLAWRLCVVQIIAGICSVITEVVLLSIDSPYVLLTGVGIWCGLVFVATGVVGVAGSRQRKTEVKTRTFTRILLVMCILSAILCIPLILLTLPNSMSALCFGRLSNDLEICKQGRNWLRKGLSFFLITVALIEAIVACWCAWLCCRKRCFHFGDRDSELNVCYTAAPPPGHTVVQTTTTYPTNVHPHHGPMGYYGPGKVQPSGKVSYPDFSPSVGYYESNRTEKLNPYGAHPAGMPPVDYHYSQGSYPPFDYHGSQSSYPSVEYSQKKHHV